MLKRLATLLGLAIFLVGAIVIVTCKNQDTAQEPQSTGQTNSLPAAISPTQGSDPSSNTQDSNYKTSCWQRFLAWPEGITTWAILATLFVVGWQSWETAKAARATEESVNLGKDTAKRQLRAYLAVTIGAGVYQDRENNLRFEGKPLLANTGLTPAHKVRFIAKAAVLPIPLPKETVLAEEGIDSAGEGFLGSQQNASMSGIVEEYCDDADVGAIKRSEGKGLFVWGIVRYQDVFEDFHYTRFCQQLTWLPDGKVFGYYVPGRNEAT